jgi:NAD(P)H-dependent FMN reductase
MNTPKIGIILSTTREGRFADKPAAWLHALAAARTDLSFELLDLRDYPMPMFDWPFSPSRKPIEHDYVVPWRNKIGALDGFIFVTAEYNRSIPAVLKNAIDHVYAEWVRKPAAYLGYGNTGGARAVEHLRNISVEMQLAPVRNGIHIGRDPLLAILREGKTFDDFPYLAEQATALLDDLSWWAWTLKAGREASLRSA